MVLKSRNNKVSVEDEAPKVKVAVDHTIRANVEDTKHARNNTAINKMIHTTEKKLMNNQDRPNNTGEQYLKFRHNNLTKDSNITKKITTTRSSTTNRSRPTSPTLVTIVSSNLEETIVEHNHLGRYTNKSNRKHHNNNRPTKLSNNMTNSITRSKKSVYAKNLKGLLSPMRHIIIKKISDLIKIKISQEAKPKDLNNKRKLSI